MSYRNQNAPPPRGFTVVELLVVMGIVMFLVATIAGSYGTFQKNQRLKVAVDKVYSTLQLARNLAISHNAVYHVRIDDITVVDPNANPWVGKYSDERFISIYAYDKTSDALRIDKEPAPKSPDWWNSYATVNDKNGNAYINQYTAAGYNNRLVERVPMDRDIYVGVQRPITDPRTVLCFFPDGTASVPDTEPFLYWVVTKEAMLYPDDATKKPYHAFQDIDLSLTDRQIVADLRKNAYNGVHKTDGSDYGDADGIRMIRVFRGGMVKVLKKELVP